RRRRGAGGPAPRGPGGEPQMGPILARRDHRSSSRHRLSDSGPSQSILGILTIDRSLGFDLRVTLDDLRVFQAVCESRNLSAVARALGRTQPAVGQHGARLERELQVTLLERSRRGVAPTAAGSILHEAASAGLGAIALALREIARLRAAEAGRLSVATGGTTVRHFLREAVIAFRRRHPG